MTRSGEGVLTLLNEESGYFHQVPEWSLNRAKVGAARAKLSLIGRIDTSARIHSGSRRFGHGATNRFATIANTASPNRSAPRTDTACANQPSNPGRSHPRHHARPPTETIVDPVVVNPIHHEDVT